MCVRFFHFFSEIEPTHKLPSRKMAETKLPAPIIAPSLLNSDFALLADTAKQMKTSGADWLHMDIMASKCIDINLSSYKNCF